MCYNTLINITSEDYMKLIKAVSRGATAGGLEKNDCTVRALANAGDIAYEDAHTLLKKHGRKNHCGAFFVTMLKAYNEAGFKLQSVNGTTGAARQSARIANVLSSEGITLAKILPKLHTGSYIVNITGHAVAVVDGKLIDTFDNSANKRVISVFKKQTT
jgi:hypothetical protein